MQVFVDMATEKLAELEEQQNQLAQTIQDLRKLRQDTQALITPKELT